MKKMTLFTATALSALSLSSQVLTVQAAPANRGQVRLPGNRIIVSYNTCSSQGLAELLKDCFPNICLPDIQFPEIEAPDCNIPEIELPDAETPDMELPTPEHPDTDMPEAELPDMESPDIEVPDNNIPNVDIPSNKPDNNQPESNTPDLELPDNNTGDIEVSPFISEIVSLVNAERAKEGLSPLTINVQVQKAAQVRAKECEQSFSHTRPNGSSFATALKEQNVSYRSAGENIAWGQRSPKDVMNAWMNSSGHRANIMNPNFTSIGVGYYQNANGTNYWCQLFIR